MKETKVMATATKNKWTYVLRTCSEDMKSYNGFKWPQEGPVECKDWSTEPECGHGLHGLLMGSGDESLLSQEPTAKWLVVKVLVQDVVVISRYQVKFPKGTVVYCGDKKGATDYIIAHGADASKVVGAFIIVGNGAVGCGSYRATVIGGYGAKVSGGDFATVIGGALATVSGGDFATVSGGEGATVSGGALATVSGGGLATVSGGYRAEVSGGNWAKVSGGEGAILQVKWYDGKRYRVAVAYVGEDGIEANVQYQVNDQGKFVKV